MAGAFYFYVLDPIATIGLWLRRTLVVIVILLSFNEVNKIILILYYTPYPMNFQFTNLRYILFVIKTRLLDRLLVGIAPK